MRIKKTIKYLISACILLSNTLHSTIVIAPKPLVTIVEEKKKEVPPANTMPEKKPEVTEKITFIVTFYTDLPEEGSGTGLTASGKKVRYGMVANNQLPFGTQINFDGRGTFEVQDRGNRKYFNRVNRIDMFIPRNKGESNYQYKRRVVKMGVEKIQGEIIKK